MKINVKELYSNPRIVYVLLNISLSGLSFVRSFISIKYLDFYELGLLGIVQILIMVMAMLQLGMVTGGYKAYSITPDSREINNTITSYIIVMLGISLPVITMAVHSGDAAVHITILGILIGAIGLYNNWLTCMMLARGDIKSLNAINLVSALASFLTLPTIIFLKLYGALLGTATASTAFCLIALIKVPYLRPFRFTMNRDMIRRLLYYGFVPYLTTTFFNINVQIERWAIVRGLGIEELGRLSLCVIISAAFMIVPSSISNLYFPSAVRSFAESNYTLFRKVMKNYILIVFSYSTAFVVATVLLVHLLVPFFFPKHIPQIHLVYWMLPSLFFTGVNTVLTIIFNAAFKYRAIITVNVIGLLCMLGGVIGILQLQHVQLHYFVAVESAVAFISFMAALAVYLKIRKQLYKSKENRNQVDVMEDAANMSDI